MRKIKGFTLVECIVALAVLGIAAMTMAQIYANVSVRNRSNHLVNTSLSNQMAYVEQYTASEAIPVYFGHGTQNQADTHATSDKIPPHETTDSVPNKNYITITRVTEDASDPEKYNPVADSTYSFPVDIYVLYSRDQDDEGSMLYNPTTKTRSTNTAYNGESEDNYNLRYKYIIGHSN